MKPRARWMLFAAACLAQWGIAGREIVRWERTRRQGTLFRFQAAPADPVDAFRGRYVAVRLRENSVPFDKPLPGGTRVYVEPETGEDGYAHFVRVHRRPPADVSTCQARVRYFSDNRLYLHLPFTRYYMNERLAPKAELALFAQRLRKGGPEMWATVRVGHGCAAIEGVFVNGNPIEEIARANKNP